MVYCSEFVEDYVVLGEHVLKFIFHVVCFFIPAIISRGVHMS